MKIAYGRGRTEFETWLPSLLEHRAAEVQSVREVDVFNIVVHGNSTFSSNRLHILIPPGHPQDVALGLGITIITLEESVFHGPPSGRRKYFKLKLQ